MKLMKASFKKGCVFVNGKELSVDDYTIRARDEDISYLLQKGYKLFGGDNGDGGATKMYIGENLSIDKKCDGEEFDFRKISGARKKVLKNLLPISVIIPFRIESGDFSILDNTLLGYSFQIHKNFEIILIDDGSEYSVNKLLRKYKNELNIMCIRIEKKGWNLSRLRNIGVRNAGYDIIISTDQDMVPSPNYVYRHSLLHSRKENIVGVGLRRTTIKGFDIRGSLENKDFGMIDKNSGFGEDRAEHIRYPAFKSCDYDISKLDNVYHWAYGCNISLNKKHIIDIGGWDEDFEDWGSEDIDFSFRLLKQGLRFEYVGSIPYHQYHESRRVEKKYKKVVKMAEKKEKLFEVIRNKRPKYSICVIAFERYLCLKNCMESIFNTTYYPYEILILNNGSKNEKIREYLDNLQKEEGNIRVFDSKSNLGCGPGRNILMDKSEGDYVLTLDDDMMLTNGWQDEIQKSFEDNYVGGVGLKILMKKARVCGESESNPWMHSNGGYIKDIGDGFVEVGEYDKGKGIYERLSEVEECDWLCGGATVWKNEVVKKVKYSEKELRIGFNDVDYGLRVKLLGYKLVNNINAVAKHEPIYETKKEKDDYSKDRYNRAIQLRSTLFFYRRWGLNPIKSWGLDKVLFKNHTDNEIKRKMEFLEVDRLCEIRKIKPKLTVVIAVYNTAKFLERCIKSVLSQTFQDFEIIIINDASTDCSEEIISKYLCDSRIRYIKNKENVGVGSVYNMGLERAKTDYLFIVDSDDWILPDALESYIDYFEKHKDCGMLHTSYIQYCGDNIERCQIWTEDMEYNKLLLERGNVVNHLRAFRVGILKKVNGFKEGMKTAEDYDIALKIVEVSKICCVPGIHYIYNKGEWGVSSKIGVAEKLDIVRDMIDDMKKRRGIKGEVPLPLYFRELENKSK